ncbi:amidohydrolase family protein [Erythrobacter sp.]|jgi:predicted TIM-barrel fold metal-dependent hydrolase|uniref:amidohydrolase family protein n=1 Tax=Erythrobacter sp. TaxID=1042 RepID=UPI002EA409DF|nr:amidohydrolase family protein [Erythrobacter sp.]
MIIDAHHHLWDLAVVDYPWLKAKGVKRFFGDPTPIQRNYDVEDFRGDWSDLPIAGSVHIQVGATLDHAVKETQWLAKRADATGLPSAIVAFADLSRANAAEVIEDHLAASRRVRGIRHIVSRHPSEDTGTEGRALLDDLQFAHNLRYLRKQDLSFDLQLTPPHLLRAAEVFSFAQGLPVAICHAGSPWSQDAAGLARWREGLKAMAQIPSVVCKLSGLGMFDREWSAESLRPIVETVLEIFDGRRVMWGSNFPVDSLYHEYRDMFEAVRSIVPAELRHQVFFDTANRFYRLGLSSEAG